MILKVLIVLMIALLPGGIILVAISPLASKAKRLKYHMAEKKE